MRCRCPYCAVGVPACCCGSPFCSVIFLLSLLLLDSLPAVAGFPVFASIPAFDGVHTVLAVGITDIACVPAVVSGHNIAIILNVACCWRYCCCLCHCCCLYPDCGRHACCCRRPLSSWWFLVVGLSVITDVPGVTNGVVGVSALPFEHAVAGGPAVTGFPAVDGVLALAETHYIIGLSTIAMGLYFFLLSNYRNIEYRIGKLKKLADYRISDQQQSAIRVATCDT